MNPEMILLTRILELRSLLAVQSMGINTNDFTPEGRVYFEAILGHMRMHKEVPSLSYFREAHSTFRPVHGEDGDAVLLADMRKGRIAALMSKKLTSMLERIHYDVPGVIQDMDLLLRQTQTYTAPTGTSRLIAGSGFQRIADRMRRQTEGGLLGVPWPWEFLNKRTQGILDHDIYFIFGREKSLKTWFSLWLISQWEEMGYRILLLTREMPKEEMESNLICMKMRLSIEDFSNAMSIEDQDRIRICMEEMLARGNVIVSDARGGMTGVQKEIQDVKPDIVIHDAWKFVANDMRAEQPKRFQTDENAVSYCIDEMMEWVERNRVPMLIVGHANREGDVANSDTIARRTKGMLRVYKDPDEDRIGVRLQSWRRSPEETFTLRSTLCTRFGEWVDFGTEWVEEALQKLKHGSHAKKAGRK